eukprot:TRINITY_DN2930_c0_g1_i3.p1 TRINITY_DN2930_c0_g1~~TRINITY_DN2930_c0_g1_i3.p1  ORF type:complete len:1526 (-),score=225.95 TRINITY_DN2930_c0_g1_i3:256-4833(-)
MLTLLGIMISFRYVQTARGHSKCSLNNGGIYLPSNSASSRAEVRLVFNSMRDEHFTNVTLENDAVRMFVKPSFEAFLQFGDAGDEAALFQLQQVSIGQDAFVLNGRSADASIVFSFKKYVGADQLQPSADVPPGLTNVILSVPIVKYVFPNPPLPVESFGKFSKAVRERAIAVGEESLDSEKEHSVQEDRRLAGATAALDIAALFSVAFAAAVQNRNAIGYLGEDECRATYVFAVDTPILSTFIPTSPRPEKRGQPQLLETGSTLEYRISTDPFPSAGHFSAAELADRELKFGLLFGLSGFILFAFSICAVGKKNKVTLKTLWSNFRKGLQTESHKHLKKVETVLPVSLDTAAPEDDEGLDGHNEDTRDTQPTEEQEGDHDTKEAEDAVHEEGSDEETAESNLRKGLLQEVYAEEELSLLQRQVANMDEHEASCCSKVPKAITFFIFLSYSSICVAFPLYSMDKVSCYEGVDWEIHLPFFFLFIVCKAWEIYLFSSMDIVVGEVDLFWPPTSSFVFKFGSSFFGFFDAYTDTLSIIVTRACHSDLWVYMGVLFALGVVFAQWFVVGLAAFYFDSSGKCFFKVLHMDVLATSIDFNPKDPYAPLVWKLINWTRFIFEDIPQTILQSLFVLTVRRNAVMLGSIIISLGSSGYAAYNAANSKIRRALDTMKQLQAFGHLQKAYDEYTEANNPSDTALLKLCLQDCKDVFMDDHELVRKVEQIIEANTGRTFTFESIPADSTDGNGFFYWLGTACGTSESWSNPADGGYVEVEVSSKGGTKYLPSALVSHVKDSFYTKNTANQWILVDCKVRFSPNHYVIRNCFTAATTSCLRNWRFEGSNDKEEWTVLKKHSDDRSIVHRSTWLGAGWKIKKGDAAGYRYFRIFQDGKNGDGKDHLGIGGLELYGSVNAEDQREHASEWIRLRRGEQPREENQANIEEEGSVPETEFRWSGSVPANKEPFDKQGLFYWLGTAKCSQTYSNPHDRGIVTVTSSTVGGGNLASIVSHVNSVFWSNDESDQWVAVDLGQHRKFRPTHYALRTVEKSATSQTPRNWQFQGSNDGKLWTTLRTHVNDESLKEGAACCHFVWEIRAQSALGLGFQHFRMYQDGPNVADKGHLAHGGMELYGTLNPSSPLGTFYKPMTPAEPNAIKIFTPSTELGPGGADFDTQGLFYWIGTAKGAAAWSNPADRGDVQLSCSSSGNSSSYPLKSVLSHSKATWYSNDSADQWFTVDLLSVGKLVPRFYRIRTVETAAKTQTLRNWRLEGSQDGTTWSLLRKHIDDCTLGGGEGSVSALYELPWVKAPAFKCFRVYQTGKNHGDKQHLACGGLELYGALLPALSNTQLNKEATKSFPAPKKLPSKGQPFDKNGLFYWLGCSKGEGPWENPAGRQVEVKASSTTKPPKALVSHGVATWYSSNTPGQWIQVDLGSGMLMKPSYYCLRTVEKDALTTTLRNWDLSGSTNGSAWDTLREHRDDESLEFKSSGDIKGWDLKCSRGYRFFKLSQTGKNGNNNDYMSCGGMELYGDLDMRGE